MCDQRPDELDARIRSLEAERLRPVPRRVGPNPPRHADLLAAAAEAAGKPHPDKAYTAAVNAHRRAREHHRARNSDQDNPDPEHT